MRFRLFLVEYLAVRTKAFPQSTKWFKQRSETIYCFGDFRIFSEKYFWWFLMLQAFDLSFLIILYFPKLKYLMVMFDGSKYFIIFSFVKFDSGIFPPTDSRLFLEIWTNSKQMTVTAKNDNFIQAIIRQQKNIESWNKK